MNDFLKTLKAGDRVIRHSWSWMNNSYFETTVKRVTPKGFFNVDGFLFYPDGRCRSGGQQLLDPNDPENRKALSRYRKEQTIRDAIRKMQNCRNLQYEQAVQILKILEG